MRAAIRAIPMAMGTTMSVASTVASRLAESIAPKRWLGDLRGPKQKNILPKASDVKSVIKASRRACSPTIMGSAITAHNAIAAMVSAG